MRKATEIIRCWLASFVATTVFCAPVVTWLLLDMDEIVTPDTNVSGVVLAPLMLAIAVGICHALAVWLAASGRTSLIAFITGACLGVVGVVCTLAAPWVAVGSYVGMFNLGEAMLPLAVCALSAGVLAVPAAAAWWVVAGVAHNKLLKSRRAKTHAA